jgi:hypothetical protein
MWIHRFIHRFKQRVSYPSEPFCKVAREQYGNGMVMKAEIAPDGATFIWVRWDKHFDYKPTPCRIDGEHYKEGWPWLTSQDKLLGIARELNERST